VAAIPGSSVLPASRSPVSGEYLQQGRIQSADKLPEEGEGQAMNKVFNLLKGQFHEIFCVRFFHEASSPKPMSLTPVLLMPATNNGNNIRLLTP
jgi:hypothetical protein